YRQDNPFGKRRGNAEENGCTSVEQMSEVLKVYAVWLREFKRLLNSKPRLIGSIVQPLFFLLALGFGIGSLVPGFNYAQFILPGIMAMSILFSSTFAGVSIIWDREFGFLKEMLVAPMDRLSIVVGRVLGGATTGVIQATIIMFIGVLLGLPHVTVLNVLLSIVFMILLASGFVALGIFIASLLNDVEGFQLVVNFVIFPLFFLSNALFPLENLPAFIRDIALLNPMSWGAGALRDILVNNSYAMLPTAFVALLFFDVVMIFVAGRAFNKTSI
ncbi:MAG: ABC transporter permease, partial [Candidatus Micrarchaeota archaeon]